ncbi:unnamed protein product [Clonostachys byssicola]|uniref:magnesium chelatase n=1 Tax=Clonostachys byssicola TaxID=160290 RepID=A0A9N9YDZ8_9HYPO|nr:unnamed protein product [Clonostachys byssicola]
MADGSLIGKVQDLSDLELALLISLVSQEHCLISTAPNALNDLVEELQLTATRTFGLSHVVIECDANTTLSSFTSALLVPKPQSPTRAPSPFSTRTESYFVSRPKSQSYHPGKPLFPGPSLYIPNVVFAKNFDLAPHAVQIQALELLRSRRIYTRTSVHTAPKQFLFVPVLGAESGGQARVTKHLNDFLFVAHWHDPDDGYINLEEADGGLDAETASTGSVVKKASPLDTPATSEVLFSEKDISHIAHLSREVDVDVEVTRYLMNVVSFLRLHRAVAEGVTPTATKHLEQLARCLAPLHDLTFVTPGLVDLAVRKVYLHRISIVMPEKERSMQWGSRLSAVAAVLEDVGPEDVIEDVLEMVTAPL